MQRPADDSERGREPQEERLAGGGEHLWVPCGAGVDGPSASAAVPSTDAHGGEGLSVTPLAEISGCDREPRVEECRVLLAGIDTLDFGMYVEFGSGWSRIAAKLAQLKRAARGTTGRLIAGRCQILPGGKPNYPFLLQYPDFHLYLSRKSRPEGETPNVFVSPTAQLLWQGGEHAAIERVKSELSVLVGGTVLETRMSRCDLAVDVLVPGGLTDGFLRRHAVSHARKHCLYLDHDRLQTMYVGGDDADTKLRIYDKSVEIAKNDKAWFMALWGRELNVDVWRFEFQLRRAALKQWGIHSLDDLLLRRADLWQHLTESWFSLRRQDASNTTRRTVHPFWQLLQQATERFGPTTEPLKRLPPQASLDPSRSVRQAAGAFVGFAARTEETSFEIALAEFTNELRRQFASRSFEDELRHKAIELGIRLDEGVS